MLTIDNVTVRIAGRVILDGASDSVPGGRRVGLVGRNGCGKSTLLKVIQGIIHPDGGETSTPKDWRIGALAQEAPSGPQPLIETVLSADSTVSSKDCGPEGASWARAPMRQSFGVEVSPPSG